MSFELRLIRVHAEGSFQAVTAARPLPLPGLRT